MSQFILSVLIVVTMGYQLSTALVCYEQDGDKSAALIEANVTLDGDPFDYCMFSVQLANPQARPSLSGISYMIDDMTPLYQRIFNKTEKAPRLFAVLSVCVLEAYHMVIDEFMLRCFCNSDRCNGQADQQGFFKELMTLELAIGGVPATAQRYSVANGDH